MKTVPVQTAFGQVWTFEDDLITTQMLRFGNHTRPEFAFACCILNAGDCVFDIGAHIGTFGIKACQSIGPHGQILCVEGSADTFEVLKRNKQSLHLDQMVIQHAIVADEPSADLRMPDLNTVAGNTGSICAKAGPPNTPVTTIDQLVETHFEPSYIKMDIEGLEAAAILKSQFVSQQKPHLYLEINDARLRDHGASPHLLNRWLFDTGYAFYVNAGPRNARFDGFKASRLKSLLTLENVSDVLCVQRGTEMFRLMQTIAD